MDSSLSGLLYTMPIDEAYMSFWLSVGIAWWGKVMGGHVTDKALGRQVYFGIGPASV